MGFSRSLPRISAISLLLLVLSGLARADVYQPIPETSTPLIVGSQAPSAYVVAPGTGIGRLIISMSGGGVFGCTGTLLHDGLYVLTAAHCLSNGSDGANPTVSSLTATFGTTGGPATFHGEEYYVSPDWTGDYRDGGDIALIRLATAAAGIPAYPLWRGADPWGEVVDVYGYGLSGQGATGETPGTFGTLRAGKNELDRVVLQTAGFPYLWDFDDGTAAHDALCVIAHRCSTGLGAAEVMVSSGDSGGPMLYRGSVLGVHSFGATLGPPVDVDGVLNASFGELAGDTRVTYYAEWIDRTMGVPEPASILLFAAALAGIVRLRRRRLR